MSYLNNNNPSEDEQTIYECTECGQDIENEGVCSYVCFKSSLI